METPKPEYGLLAEFETPEALLGAARAAYAAGYRRIDAFSPFPIDGLAEAIGFKRNRIPLLVLLGGLFGGGFGYWMLWYVNVVDYPINVGGRPHHSWPSFIPITFELTILFAVLAAVLGMVVMNGLPRLHHPLFGSETFSRATQDRFFLLVEHADPQYERDETRRALRRLHALTVEVVPRS